MCSIHLTKRGDQIIHLSCNEIENNSLTKSNQKIHDELIMYPVDLPFKIHNLIYCPTMFTPKPFSSLTMNDYLQDMSINVFNFIRVLRSCINRLRNTGNAHVVVFSDPSILNRSHMSCASNISNAALIELMMSLAREYDIWGIRFHTIAFSHAKFDNQFEHININTKNFNSSVQHQNLDYVAQLMQTIINLETLACSYKNGDTIFFDHLAHVDDVTDTNRSLITLHA